MLRLIVFDCDGVLFDSKRANCMYYNQLLAHFGLRPMSADEEDYVHMHSVSESVRHIFRHYRRPSPAEVDGYRQTLDYGPFLRYMEMESGLVEFLEATSRKYHLAISTNRTTTMIPLLRSYKLEGYFAKVVTAATAKRPKPAPDGLLEILDHFHCRPEEAIFIGDSLLDQQHAEGCGVPLIAFKNRNLRAEYHVDSFAEILRLRPFRGGPAGSADVA